MDDQARKALRLARRPIAAALGMLGITAIVSIMGLAAALVTRLNGDRVPWQAHLLLGMVVACVALGVWLALVFSVRRQGARLLYWLWTVSIGGVIVLGADVSGGRPPAALVAVLIGTAVLLGREVYRDVPPAV